jgi:hypothetical protein
MNRNPTQIFLILGGIALSVFAGIKLLSGGWLDTLWFMACLVPFLLALVLGVRNWWPLLALLIPLVPLPRASALLLDKITPSVMFNLAMIAFFLGHVAITRTGVPLKNKYIRPFLIVARMITLRIVVDPPGSGRFGKTGGLNLALMYLLSGWAFFAVLWATRESTVDEKRFFRAFMACSIIILGFQFYRNSDDIVYELFHRRSWTVWPLLLAWAAYRFGALRNHWLLFHLLTFAMMFFSLVNPHRKSIYMAAIVAMVVAWIFRREKRQAVLMGTAAVLGLAALFATGRVPESMKRALSTIVPSIAIERVDAVAVGWKDDFRYQLFQFALSDITQSPIVGKGFAWSTEDAVEMLRRRRFGGLAGRTQLAVEVGNTHFGFLDLMIRIGTIIPWFYMYALIGILLTFIVYARSLPVGYPKALAAALSGYTLNNVFQWLLNGSGRQMMIVSIALGVMLGLLHKWGHTQPAEKTGRQNLDKGLPLDTGAIDA